MLASILLKHFPTSPVPVNDFIKMMRQVQTESCASSEAVCEAVAGAVKAAAEAVATKEAWTALLEHVKPEVLNVPLAQPGIFSRLWSALFGPAAVAPEVAAPAAVAPEVAAPVAAAPEVAAPVASAAEVAAPVAAAPEVAEPVAAAPEVAEPKDSSIPEEKHVVPEPEIQILATVQEPKEIAEPDKCEVPQVPSNPDASPKAAGAQKKKKNHGHK